MPADAIFQQETVQQEAVLQRKAALRLSAKARRQALPARDADAAATQAAVLFLRHIPVAATAVISGYWPMAGELDPRPLLMRLHEAGHTLAMPVTRGRGHPLAFRRWRPGDPMAPGGFGTSVPLPDAGEVVPTLLIVPLLAIDSDGYRLGYGGGYYDRTLRALRAGKDPITAVGFAFETQQVPDVPHHSGDERLDWLVTDIQARSFDARRSRCQE